MSKKILLVANTAWYLYNFRVDLIEKLQSKGFEPVIVCPASNYSKKFESLGVRHIDWDVGRKSINPLREINSVYRLWQIYKREKPSVIHHHTNKAVIYGSIASVKLDLPTINSIPGRGYVFSSNSFVALILRSIIFILYKLFVGKLKRHYMIFENREDMNYFVKNKIIPKNKVNLIPSVGVNTTKFSPSPITSEVFTIAFVGRLLIDKGVRIFSEASKILAQRGFNYRMVLVGLPDPGNPNSLTDEQVREWEQKKIISWWGWQEDMAKIYQKIHVLANPTFYGEGVPTIILEAGASQRAVIATDWPGCREVITHNENGLLVEPKNAHALADAIEYLATHKDEFDRMRGALREKILRQFSTDSVNSETFAIYDQLLSE